MTNFRIDVSLLMLTARDDRAGRCGWQERNRALCCAAAKEGQTMEETRATARLPGLDIEIYHAGDDLAETLTVRLRATPDFRAVGELLDPMRIATWWLALNPWLAFNPWVTGRLAARPTRELPPG
jgi:hypothetical protein